MNDINIGQITEALNNKVDLPTNPERAQDQIDYVVDWQVPTEENNHTWYRKYKWGWVEQGGDTNAVDTTITLPVPMADTNYFISGGGGFVINSIANSYVTNKTTTSITFGSEVRSSGFHGWEVKGMAA